LKIFEKWGIATARSAIPASNFDLVVEASGAPEGWHTAVSAVKPRGTIVLKSTYKGDLNFNPAPLVINEITVVGSRCGRFPPALRLLKSGLIEVKPLISKVFKFEDIISAFECAKRPETTKVLVEIGN
jgi:threonine dehydrogenase-like Zn-dependent dehydrogenase